MVSATAIAATRGLAVSWQQAFAISKKKLRWRQPMWRRVTSVYFDLEGNTYPNANRFLSNASKRNVNLF
jgi:hypothetical protein